jgi:hypothetical protein
MSGYFPDIAKKEPAYREPHEAIDLPHWDAEW